MAKNSLTLMNTKVFLNRLQNNFKRSTTSLKKSKQRKLPRVVKKNQAKQPPEEKNLNWKAPINSELDLRILETALP
jgi:hypothetical protein